MIYYTEVLRITYNVERAESDSFNFVLQGKCQQKPSRLHGWLCFRAKIVKRLNWNWTSDIVMKGRNLVSDVKKELRKLELII